MKKEFLIRLALVVVIAGIVYLFGIKPIFSNDFTYEARKNNTWAFGKLTKDIGQYDIVVVGEEPEGIAAAVSSARLGARTLLLAQGNDLGGVVSQSLQCDLEINLGLKGDILNQGIFAEIYDKLGEKYSVDKYIKTVTNLVKDEKKIDVVYKVQDLSPVIENNAISGVTVSVDGKKNTYKGKRFIDATRDGQLLLKCKVPYTVGSEDINLKNSFSPVKLNFILDGVEWESVKDLLAPGKAEFSDILKRYKSSHVNTKINDFKLIYQDVGKVIVQGVEVMNVDPLNAKAMSEAYNNAVSESKDLTDYLKIESKEFKDAKFLKAADKLYVRETRHFTGEHVLSISEVLENRDCTDKIALASYPVIIGKFSDGNNYIIGKPAQYAIPLGCIIPLKVDNLLMTGGKASFSSLAAASAGSLSVGVNLGESAGVIAVYSITREIRPRDILTQNFSDRIKEVERLLKRQGINLPDFETKNKFAENWSYPYVRDLNTLGLLAGGLDNNYLFDREASSQDFAILLLNGIYRSSPGKYTLELDSRLRPLFTYEKLTIDKAAEILNILYGDEINAEDAYGWACQRGYINTEMQLRLKGKSVLTMDDVYYLTDYNIKKFVSH